MLYIFSRLKKTIVRSSFILLVFSFFLLQKNIAQVNFPKITWAEACKKAAASNKLIFLDAYTTWCAPCKMMEKEVFPRVPVGDFYNNNFICVKMNMEKGEGLALARKYNIHAFPTFIFANAEGKMLHTDAGGKSIDQTLAMGNLAMNPTERMDALDTKFLQGGSAEEDFLKTYIDKRFNLQNYSHQAAAEAYLLLQNSWETPENIDFISKYIQNPGSKAFTYLLDNKAKFIKQLGKPKVESKIESCIYEELNKGNCLTGVEAMTGVLQRQYKERADYYLARYKVVYAKSLYDIVTFQSAATDYFTKFPPEDPAEWGNIALYATHFPLDKSLLKTAIAWTDKGIAQEDNFDCRLAKAQLLAYMGKHRKAKKSAKSAIAFAKKSGEDAAKAIKFLEGL
jgi:thioredoxin-related protein